MAGRGRGRVIKKEIEQQVIPIQIVHANFDGTATYTIQHFPTNQLQEEINDIEDEEVESHEIIHHVVEVEEDGDGEEKIVGEEDSDNEIFVYETEHHQISEPEPSTLSNHSTQSTNTNDNNEGETESETKEFAVLPQTSRQNKSKLFYCPNCGNCYGAAGSLKLHIRACLRQKESEQKALEARKCNICGKIYNSTSYLKEHILRHSGKAPKKCPKCYRKFIDDEKLKAHIKMHDDVQVQHYDDGSEKKIVKQYNCSFCQKKFQVVFNSRYTKRRYACDECRDKFTNEENLRHHKESLEEKKEFHCDRCGRKFVFEGFLQRHTPTCDGTIKRKRDRVF